MSLEAIRARAREEASQLPDVERLPEAEEQVRAEIAEFWAKVPEPPAYRRKDEPLREQARALLEQAVPLYAKCLQLERSEALAPWTKGLEAHLDMLALLADGRVEAADEAWRRAQALEKDAARARRLWARSDEAVPRVYDRERGVSRYDPRPDVTWTVHLVCPLCRATGDYSFSPRHATHRFSCRSCREPFTAYLAELRSLDVQTHRHRHHYRFRVEELTGQQTRVEFDDQGQALLSAARRDLLAFLYAPGTALRAVLNLSSSRVLWVRSPTACFLATAVYGEDAPQLDAFRAWRDQVLLRSRGGALLVAAYYRAGPLLASAVRRTPGATRAVRAALDLVHQRLTRTP